MGNAKRRKIIVGVCVFFCVLLIISIVVIESMKKNPDMQTLIQNIILSILCSVVASFVFMYIQKGTDQDENAELVSRLMDIDSKLKLQEALYDSGIKSIRKKTYYDQKNDFWNNIIRCTESRLDLTGHSLSQWFKSEYKSVFCGKIKEMLNAQKQVRIILSCSKGEYDEKRIQNALGNEDLKKQLKKTEKTVCELATLISEVDVDKRKNLEIYVTDKTNVTYLYIRTDNQCFISPYISNERSKGDTFLLELETGVDYSRCFDEDFEEMISSLNSIKWT